MTDSSAPRDAESRAARTVDPLDAVAGMVEEAGVSARRLRELIIDVSQDTWSIDQLVRRTALPRRSVEAALRAAGSDVESGPQGISLRQDRAAAYRERFGDEQLSATSLDDVVGRRLTANEALVRRIEEDIASGPAARGALDHVSATAETVVRRALWLDGALDLSGRRLLCVGDHDLTSLAVCAVNGDVDLMVADIDERILEFIDTTARSRGLRIRCQYADFRFGLPDEAVDWADVVLTDPPYTPEGVQLFLGRGLQGLRDRIGGRLVMAYGFSELVPALGVKVQRAVLDLDLAIQTILPRFNRYQGAQAVGSASDLYVCQPTPRTWKVLERRLAQVEVHIYTHGEQSLEGEGRLSTTAEADALRSAAAADGEKASLIAVNPPRKDSRSLALGSFLTGGLPTQWIKRRPVAVTVDLSSDPGPWLLRALLAADADRVAVLVPNDHPDLADEAGQRRLADLIAPKYTLRFRRSTPSSRWAIVEASSVDAADLDAGTQLARRMLDRAHGKVSNVWRDGLISSSRGTDVTLTKNQARDIVRKSITRPELLNARIIDLPRHQLRDVLDEVAESAKLAA